MRKRKKKIAVPAAPAPSVTHACIACGRGEINASLLPPPYDAIDTGLELVPCADTAAHRPPGGRHLGRCGGYVYHHRNPRICEAVKRIGAPVALPAGGAN